MKNKLILGYFGSQNNQINGQTIKAYNVYKLFKKSYVNVDFFDTQKLNLKKFSIFELILKLFRADEIILMPGINNLAKFHRILKILNSTFNKKIYFFAVGGWLSEYYSQHPKVFKSLNTAIEHYFVESQTLLEALKVNNNITNITIFPNFRIHNFKAEISKNEDFKIIFMARITPEKGCNLLLDFADYYVNNTSDFNKKIIIDFYGPMNPDYEQQFTEKVSKYDFVNYKGVVEPEQVFKVLNKYDVNVLPTYYQGEGFPGTIIDSYIAAVPIIVSNWKGLPEFVQDNITGYVLHDYSTVSELNSRIIYLVNNQNVLIDLKRNALHKSEQYSYDSALAIVKNII